VEASSRNTTTTGAANRYDIPLTVLCNSLGQFPREIVGYIPKRSLIIWMHHDGVGMRNFPRIVGNLRVNDPQQTSTQLDRANC